MSKLGCLIKSPRIQISLATGISIIVMALVSKRVLTEPIGYLYLAFPPFLMTIYEAVAKRHENSRISAPGLWVAAILIATALVIAFHIFRAA